METRFQVGVITSPHGVIGEVNVFPTTDDPKRFRRLKEVILVQGKNEKTVEIESVKFFKNMVILKLAGYDDRDAVEKLRQCSLFVPREKAVRLKEDEYFIADLMGLKVLDGDAEDAELGTLEDVMETGANDVYVIRLLDGRELLLPAIKQCILEVNVEEGFVRVHVLDGLL
ncbi:MAG: 16S rRNA processing protein RimM [Lachnospiraceae bacterium]|nr:16S rRNA processing protein RimM [Lachnospiraceae bacterium]MBO7339952.1 16S rRNA processing protein RimM [Lachnospiraceae bacterium]MBP5263055.1 16S rRNA processing protein RimM [Lachnospiraceae bacterium]MBP5670508.1 16S rRNA processing protein RimM [Lachnospiraceae bacterium]MBP5734047.1 16S rRNA processing protein RimM [Lachnospiraceae bacterium]